jgi:hypothetical protein
VLTLAGGLAPKQSRSGGMSGRARVGSMLAATLAAVALAAIGCAARPSASRSGPGRSLTAMRASSAWSTATRSWSTAGAPDRDRRARERGPRRPVACFGRGRPFHGGDSGVGDPRRLRHDVGPSDRYGRELAYVYRLPDLLFVHAALVRAGYAMPLTTPPNVAYAAQFVRLAARARALGLGLCVRGPGSDSQPG